MKKHNDLYYYQIDDVPEYLVTLKSKLKDLRENAVDEQGKKLTQPKLAQALHCDYRTIQTAEDTASAVNPSLPLLLAYCQLFDCDMDYLLGKRIDESRPLTVSSEYSGLSKDALKSLHRAKLETNRKNAIQEKIYKQKFGALPEWYEPIQYNTYEDIASRIIQNGKLIALISKYAALFEKSISDINNLFDEKSELIADMFFELHNDDTVTLEALQFELDQNKKEHEIYSASILNGLKLSLAEEVADIVKTILPKRKTKFEQHIDDELNRIKQDLKASDN